MSSVVQRVSILALGTSAMAIAAGPAAAQVDRNIVMNIMIECAKIDDPTARLACYDNNMRQVGATPRNTIPGQVRGVQGGAAPVETQGPQGFGADDLRTQSPARFATPSGQLQEIHPRVASVTPREPGIYLVTLDDGAQWVFAESVSSNFRLPRRGEEVEIERGSLGSYLLRVEQQPAVPVRRVR
jgi:hypothetical protein